MTRLEQERRRKGLNQTDLAFAAKLTQGEISRLERRSSPISRASAAKLGWCLGIAPDQLLDDAETPTETPTEETPRG